MGSASFAFVQTKRPLCMRAIGTPIGMTVSKKRRVHLVLHSPLGTVSILEEDWYQGCVHTPQTGTRFTGLQDPTFKYPMIPHTKHRLSAYQHGFWWVLSEEEKEFSHKTNEVIYVMERTFGLYGAVPGKQTRCGCRIAQGSGSVGYLRLSFLWLSAKQDGPRLMKRWYIMENWFEVPINFAFRHASYWTILSTIISFSIFLTINEWYITERLQFAAERFILPSLGRRILITP